jgi:hypothetical protein
MPVVPPTTPRLRVNPRHLSSPRGSSRPKYIHDDLSQRAARPPHVVPMDVSWDVAAPPGDPQDVKVQDADGFVQRRYFFTERQYEDERAPVQGKHFDVMLDMPPPDYSGDHLVRSFPQPSPRTRLYSVAPRYAPATRFPHRKRAAAEGRGARSTAATSTS